ncbi:MAG: hypothetical protein SPK45_03280, partial [Anaerovoracaceae bacterium]|nr:hypothetical protein [Anaerovoracaceae bacterium]
MIALVFSFYFYLLYKFDFFIDELHESFEELRYLFTSSTTSISASARAVSSGTIRILTILTWSCSTSVTRAEIHEGIYPSLAISYPYAFLLFCFFFFLYHNPSFLPLKSKNALFTFLPFYLF